MKPLIVALFMFCCVGTAFADIASVVYVDNAVATCVSTQSSAEQKLEGKYTVSGSFDVPTPTLPSKME